ncbi:MAG: hypothetical protein A2279_05545 [Stygiobacter sp. RIFOXYA12_FULL_38_9]|nr:MAG: hypothetical protein A2X62_16300 [Stygiobacter sp. GWC2_38_9]OGU83864.1 MAG: hypothetical protein A2279_05545 [Stygiobacter sp. RIFOXYA12_FULL_38_9]OGV06335.1 MAG: hypothetical protein A2299_13010 [Stygiobacter sp. RIFOXYB2_FULL_37_11]OGV11056.1 MAG: hypothetical protein A2237_04430 [Stygiobacter sp. RIFOXYA2_FULL_38_8]OGV15450.1 MAG: hypothetical protein A2440_00045 [Stygiobacter sp. RIFOXYC2_FULL_38_25]OGV80563.1 MAG: hypothetical protein A2X65_05095 [Stygiobacter sp. GWF2_38_21]RJQ
MSVLETILISSLTSAFALVYYAFRQLLKEKSKTKAELEQNKRDAFKKMLDEHSELVMNIFHDKPLKDWQKDFSEMSKSILSWGSDDVLSEYGKYAELYYTDGAPIKERELHFASAILAFRKELGYKNKKGIITPEQIIYIFRCGHNKNI